VFREVLDQCDQILTSILPEGLTSWLFSDSPQHDINQTQFAQIGLFCVSYAQARLWQSWGVEPDALLGHSMHGATPIDTLLDPQFELDLAVINSPEVAVVAGTDSAIEQFAMKLKAQGIHAKTLRTSHAFHSSMMEPMLDEFADIVGQVKLQSPRIPYLSNVTGTWITDSEALDPSFALFRHQPRFDFNDSSRQRKRSRRGAVCANRTGTILGCWLRSRLV